jgi:hypothetical protein
VSSDIVERLRGYQRDPEMSDDDLSLCGDAADEIERLWAEVERLQVQNRFLGEQGAIAHANWKAQCDEVERLRGETSLLMEVLTACGDLLISDWDEEYEGWKALLHDTSKCWCHADADLRCDTCGDPIAITKKQRDLLVRLGVAVGEARRG